MADKARIFDVSALATFRPAIVEFRDEARRALGQTETTARRTLTWLQRERGPELVRRERQLDEEIKRVRSEISIRHVSTLQQRAPVELRKLADKLSAERRVVRAKIEDVKKWIRLLERQIELFRGAAGPLSSIVNATLPEGEAVLERSTRALEAYAALGIEGLAEEVRAEREAAGEPVAEVASEGNGGNA